jgi:3-dehydroquinate synthase
MSIVLIGPPGAGKSSVGRALAARLGRAFVDTDEVITARHGAIPEIFARDGEDVFRRLEAQVVVDALAGVGADATEAPGGDVVSLGGGAPLQPAVQAVLAGHRIVLLDVADDTVARRLAADRAADAVERPLLAGGLDTWCRLHDERIDTYRRLADVAVDTSALAVDEVVDRVVDALGAGDEGTAAGETAADERVVSGVVSAGATGASAFGGRAGGDRAAGGGRADGSGPTDSEEQTMMTADQDQHATGQGGAPTSQPAAPIDLQTESPAANPTAPGGDPRAGGDVSIRRTDEGDVRVVHVAGDRPYDVFVGPGAFDLIGEAIDDRVRRILIVHQPSCTKLAEELREGLSTGVVTAMTAEVPDAEAAKRIEVASFLWQLLGQADFTRTDLIIGLGGGAVTDLAGFVAATWLRGVKVLQIPTTVLGMADAAVGGKTGVNTAEGKNLVGAFHPPVAVFADPRVLATLPRNELLTGYAEVIKCGFIGDNTILDLIEQHHDAAVDPHSPVFLDALSQAVALKAEVVSADLRESGRREILNYGHTLGHAIEYAERYQWRHGAAVSVGMAFAAHLANLTGHLDDAGLDRHYRVLQSLGLPTTYRRGAWDQLLAVMHRDKKTRGDVLRFIILDGIGHPIVLTGPEPDLLFTAYQEIAE